MPINVFIADDHAVVREGLKAVLGRCGRRIHVVGEASNGRDLLRISGRVSSAIYLVDISMPHLNGIEVCSRLVKKHPQCSVIILSMHDNVVLIERAFAAGARGYILKDSAIEEIIPAIGIICKGGIFISERLRNLISRPPSADQPSCRFCRGKNDLTTREKEILQHVAEGKSSKQIAATLFISLHTVLTHRRNMARKLGIHNQVDLIRYALKHIIPVIY